LNHLPGRAFALAGFLILLASSISGCSGQQAGTDTALRIWYSTDDPVERIWSQDLATRFEATHPHTHVQLTPYSFADLNTKLQLALSGGNPPDLAYVTPRGPGIPAYVGAHRLLDLTAVAQAHDWASKLRPGLLSRYNQPFAFYGARSGSVMAVPTSLAAVAVLYNRALLAKLRLGVPRTIGELQAAAARAAAAGYTPIGIGNADGWLGDDWYLTLVNALLPPSALQPEQRLDAHFSFRRPPYVRAATLLEHWSNAGYFTIDFGGLDAQEGIDLFFQGKTLFQLVSSSQNTQILADELRTRLPIGVFAFPAGAGARTIPYAGYLGWIVPSASRHRSEAIAFIDMMLTPSTAELLSSHGLLAAHRPLSGQSVTASPAASWQADYTRALNTARPGLYIDAAPIANLNATMEANVQLLMQGYETPGFLVRSLQEVYASHGKNGSTARIDGEF
jgi:raffinose/stachyose/melibiose transport system substrate-binding protein